MIQRNGSAKWKNKVVEITQAEWKKMKKEF